MPVSRLLAASLAVAAVAADFPPPDQLPTRPEVPDPLVTFAGDKVTSKDQWPARRAELKELFQHYMYGRFPAAPAVTAKVVHEDAAAFKNRAIIRELELRFGDGYPPVYLLVAIPKKDKPVGCFVGPNFHGNHAFLDDPKVRIPDGWMYPNRPGVKDNRATEEGRGAAVGDWPLFHVISRGYAVATFYNGDVQPDRPTVDEGVRKALGAKNPDDFPNVMLWAWGISRAVDYLSTVKEIDPKRIAAVGHSRLGKAALVAGAFDERIALTIPNQAGCGGSGPSRHADPKAESVSRINTAFPHWFSPRFKPFGGALDKLPFDQHCLVALCAPRPVLFTAAAEDVWANPAGQFDVLKRATPVYELLGVKGLEATAMPEHGKAVESRLGYYIRAGKHAMTPVDWVAYLNYADVWLK